MTEKSRPILPRLDPLLPQPLQPLQVAISAFNASTHRQAKEDEFIIDSGAAHHMVFSSSLLENVGPLPSTKHIKVGNGALLPFSLAGTLRLGGIWLENVLLVPGLTCNLISVRSTPSRYRWDFSPHSITLYTLEHHEQLVYLQRQVGTLLFRQTSLILLQY